MQTLDTRFSLSNIVAACIIAAGLIGAARIIAQKPANPSGVHAVLPVTVPPLSQESVRQQVRDQILASSRVHTFDRNTRYTLADVNITQVVYDAKQDTFQVQFDWVWQPKMQAGGPEQDSVFLYNNGYNQYVGPAVLSPIVNGTGQIVNLCIK